MQLRTGILGLVAASFMAVEAAASVERSLFPMPRPPQSTGQTRRNPRGNHARAGRFGHRAGAVIGAAIAASRFGAIAGCQAGAMGARVPDPCIARGDQGQHV